MTKDENGWDEYKLLVLDTLKRIETAQQAHASQMTTLQQDFTTLKTEAKVAKYFGGVVLPAGIALGVSWLGRKLGL